MQSSSDILANLSAGVASIHNLPNKEKRGRDKLSCFYCLKDEIIIVFFSSLPILLTGQDLLHSCLHFFGLQRSLLTMAILVNLSAIFPFTNQTTCQADAILLMGVAQSTKPRPLVVMATLTPMAGGANSLALLNDLLHPPEEEGQDEDQVRSIQPKASLDITISAGKGDSISICPPRSNRSSSFINH